MLTQFASRREYVLGRLAEIPDISLATPGGAFYAFADAARLGVRLDGRDTAAVVAAGRAVSEAVRARLEEAGATEITAVSEFDGGEIFFARDPDLNLLGFAKVPANALVSSSKFETQ